MFFEYLHERCQNYNIKITCSGSKDNLIFLVWPEILEKAKEGTEYITPFKLTGPPDQMEADFIEKMNGALELTDQVHSNLEIFKKAITKVESEKKEEAEKATKKPITRKKKPVALETKEVKGIENKDEVKTSVSETGNMFEETKKPKSEKTASDIGSEIHEKLEKEIKGTSEVDPGKTPEKKTPEVVKDAGFTEPKPVKEEPALDPIDDMDF